MGVGPLLSAAVAFGALLWALFAAYRTSFKTDEVRAWAKDCIATLQTISLLANKLSESSERDEKLFEMAISSSVLLEQGRLYFRNNRPSKYGTSKHPAYRGFRPAILDELLISHDIATRFHQLNEEDQRLSGQIAASCERRFVSLAQMEVGRLRTASRYNEGPGDGQDLDCLLEQARREGRITRLKIDF